MLYVFDIRGFVFVFKQKTAYEMRISDWSSDVCSSDLVIVYAIAGWVVIEVAATMLPGLNLPDWTVTFVIALVVLGFPIAVIMGWMFDLGPRGAERTIE